MNGEKLHLIKYDCTFEFCVDGGLFPVTKNCTHYIEDIGQNSKNTSPGIQVLFCMNDLNYSGT